MLANCGRSSALTRTRAGNGWAGWYGVMVTYYWCILSFSLSLSSTLTYPCCVYDCRYLAAELQVPWRESWPFLNVFDDLRHEQCLDRLEAYLERHSQQLADKHSSQQQSDMSALAYLMGDLCLHDVSVIPATPPSSPTPSRRVSIDDQAEPWPEFSASQLAELDATFSDDVTNMLTSVSEVISRSRRNSDRGTDVESSGESFHTARDSDDGGEGQAGFVDLSQSLLDLPDIYLEGCVWLYYVKQLIGPESMLLCVGRL